MISRVTSQTLAQSALRNLQSGLNDLSRLQNQATSQRAFAAPSDDPAAASAALDLHAAQHRNAQYARNIGDGLTWVTTVDNAISASTSLLGRARDLTLRGANSGALDANAREAIALELETIADELFAQANTTLLGRSVFAGTTEGSAFADDFTFAGVPGSEVRRRVADGETALVFVGGEQSHAFTKGPMLPPPGQAPEFDESGTFAEERLQPADPDVALWELGHAALAAAAARTGVPASQLLYGRVDIIGGPDDPRLLELELVEPSLGWRQLDDGDRARRQRRFALEVESALERFGLGPFAQRRP